MLYWGPSQAQTKSGLETRASGRGDGFRSAGGEQVSNTRKQRYAQTTISRRAARHLAAFRCCARGYGQTEGILTTDYADFL